MSYNTYLNLKDLELQSPRNFGKNPSQVGYGNSTKNQEIQKLKQKYGVGKNSKKNTFNDFGEIKKVSEDLSSLRQTINSTGYNNKFHKSSIDQANIKDTFKKSTVGKPDISLRQTLYEKKNQNQDTVPSFLYSTNSYSHYKEKKEPQEHKYSIKVNEFKETKYQPQKQKIDFDKINQKFQTNVMMIQELRRLKEQRKNRRQKQSKLLGTNEADLKLISSKSAQIQTHTPKYTKTNPQTMFKKPMDSQKYQLNQSQKLKHYSTHDKPKYQPINIQKSKYQTPIIEKSKYQSPKLQKHKYESVKFQKNKYQTPVLEKYKYQSKIQKSKYDPITTTEKLKSTSSITQKSKQNNLGTVKDLRLIKNLGQGKFGTVFLSLHIPTGAIFALKKVPKIMIKQHFLIDQFILELKLQSYFNHNNILGIFGYFDDQQSIYLVLQYMEEGTLFSYLKKYKTLNEKDAAKKIKDVAEAVNKLHEQGVAHRDIKPENIVMSYGVCKLCDFGWATVCNERRKTYCGTFDYAAPQILEGAQYDMSVDTWCLGILAYELMVGKAPFYHISRKETMKKIMNVDNQSVTYPQSMTKNATSFIENLIIKNPEQRMKSDQILKHKFLDIKEQNKLI